MKRMNVGEVEKKCWIFSMDKIAADLMGKSMWQTLQQQITLLENLLLAPESSKLSSKNNKNE